MEILNSRKPQFILFTFVIFVLVFTLISQVGMAAYCGGPSGCAEGYECVDGDCVPKEEDTCDTGDYSSNECGWGCKGKYETDSGVVCCDECCDEPSCSGIDCGPSKENSCGLVKDCGSCTDSNKECKGGECVEEEEESDCSVDSRCYDFTEDCVNGKCRYGLNSWPECEDCLQYKYVECDECGEEGDGKEENGKKTAEDCKDDVECEGEWKDIVCSRGEYNAETCEDDEGTHYCCVDKREMPCDEPSDCLKYCGKEIQSTHVMCTDDKCKGAHNVGKECPATEEEEDEEDEDEKEKDEENCCKEERKKCKGFFVGGCLNGICLGRCIGGGGGQTTTTSSTTTSTSSTTSTTTSIPPFDISCGKNCTMGQDCKCNVSKGNVSSGLWILRGSALKIPIVEDIPPKELSFKPDKEGEVKVLAMRFSPVPSKVGRGRVNVSQDKSSPNPPPTNKKFSCKEECNVGEDCECNISKCKLGRFVAKDSEGKPLDRTVIDDVSDCESCKKSFVAESEGIINTTLVCFDPMESYGESVKIKTPSNVTPQPSDKSPKYSKLEIYPENNSLSSESDKYYLNSTWIDPNGTVTDVALTLNGTRFLLNKNELNKSNNEYYRVFRNLSAGIYNYRWKAVDNASNVNQTPIKNYRIKTPKTLQESEIKLTLNGNRGDTTIGSGEDITIRVEELNTEGETLYLYRNLTGTMQRSVKGGEPIEDTISVGMVSEGLYRIVGNWSGNSNYKPDSESWFLNVTSD